MFEQAGPEIEKDYMIVLFVYLTQYSNCGSESGRILILNEVNELLHHHICFTLTILDVKHQSVFWKNIRIVIYVIHRHDCN